jgi:hypothetical protein
MPQDDLAVANTAPDDSTGGSEPDVPDDPAEPFQDDPPPPFSDPPSEAADDDPGPDPSL